MSASKNSKDSYFFLLIALYSVVLLASVLYTETFVEPKFFEGLSEDHKALYDHRHPPYPWGVVVFFLCIPTFLLVYFAPNIYAKVKRRFAKISDRALIESIIVYFGYMIPAMISQINCGFWIDHIALHACFGFIPAGTVFVRRYEIDSSFLDDPSIPVDVKIESLKMSYDFWFRGLKVLGTVAIALCVTLYLRLSDLNAKYHPEVAHIADNANMLLALIAGVGLTAGVFRGIVGKMTDANTMFTKIKKTNGDTP